MSSEPADFKLVSVAPDSDWSDRPNHGEGWSFADVDENRQLLASLPVGFIEDLSRAADSVDVLNGIAHWLPRILEADRASVALLLNEREFLVHSLEGARCIPRDVEQSLLNNAVGLAVDSGRVVMIHDTNTPATLRYLGGTHSVSSSKLGAVGLHSCMCAPLMSGDRCFGTVNIAGKDSAAYDQDDARLLRALAMWAASCLRTQQHAQETEEINQRLVVASRQAGKAEIATGVLHNVGNVMNSVNVTAGILQDCLRKRLQGHLQSAVELLTANEDNLAEFLTSDPRGQHFLPFLRQMSEQSATAVIEVENLRANIDHVNAVVAAQQSFATTSGVTTSCSPQAVVEAAIQITNETCRRLAIRFERDFESTTNIVTDKQKLLQILVNLLRNAKHAITDNDSEDRVIHVSIRQSEESVAVSVRDTGIGIVPDNLSRIFQHGFSTRKNRGGHGFGLHHSCCSVQEMGGRLIAESPGAGQGATFTVELPIEASNRLTSDAATGTLA